MPWMLILALVMLVVSFAISAIANGRQSTDKPRSISDFQFPQSAEGQPQAVIFGDCWSADHQILWYGRFRNSPVRVKQKKKG